ncbi:MFS domain-containing protein [Fusarium keratoplasticum]|nr:MFS domain-containing protein [Fusarium keratoplasticum]
MNDPERQGATAPDATSTMKQEQELSQQAYLGSATEQHMGIIEGFRTYPKAVIYSIILSTAIIMEGFDMVLIASFFSMPAFAKQYGTLSSNGSHQVSANWQAGLINGNLAGQIIGVQLTGTLAERFGYRYVMFGALFMTSAFIFIVFFAKDILVLTVGESIVGIPWGIFQTLTTVYASEVCPVSLRAYLTTYVNFCWTLGQLLGSAVVKGTSTRSDEWAYRIPFAVQWIWPVPIALGVYFAPESPWWLVRKNRHEQAKKSLRRLTSEKHSTNIDETLAMIVHTNNYEMTLMSGARYRDCFRGINLRRTEIVSMIWMTTLVAGNLISMSTYFMQQAGLSTDYAFDMTVVNYAGGIIGGLALCFIVPYAGRRTIYLWGLCAVVLVLMMMGFLAIAPASMKGASWATAIMLILSNLIYNASVGPLSYCLVTEIPSTRLRNKTVVLGRGAYNILAIVAGILNPYQLNPDAWNWSGYSGFFWGGLTVIGLVWTFLRLPETKNRTYEELDVLFERKTPARKFKSSIVSILDGEADSQSLAGVELSVQDQKHMDGK